MNRRILTIYPQTEVNGVMKIVQTLYEEEPCVTKLGVWFDEALNIDRRIKKAHTKKAREEIKGKVKDYLLYNEFDLIHLNTCALDQDYIDILEKKKKEGTAIIYTAHSLVAQDFQRTPFYKRLFDRIQEPFLKDLINISKKAANGDIDWYEKQKEIKKTLANHGKLDEDFIYNQTNVLDIITYIMSNQLHLMDISDKVVFVSNFLNESAKNLYNFNKGLVINNGTRMYEVYDRNEKYIEDRRRAWRSNEGYKDKDFVIICSGRTTFSKGADDLINAFKYLPENFYLYFQGTYDDEVYSFLENNPKAGKNIFLIKKSVLPNPLTYKGELDMACAYHAADLLVHPSRYETFGLAPIESVSCKTPALVRFIDNLTNFVEEGVAAGFGEASTPKELASNIRAICQSLEQYKENTIRARDVVMKKYSANRMRKEYLELFDRV